VVAGVLQDWSDIASRVYERSQQLDSFIADLGARIVTDHLDD
jgi:hypothetical protein